LVTEKKKQRKKLSVPNNEEVGGGRKDFAETRWGLRM
jgi:hypothetical protein